MKQSKVFLKRLALVVIVTLVQNVSSAEADPPHFHVTILGTLAGTYSEATAINNAGQVVAGMDPQALTGMGHSCIPVDR